MQVNRNPISTRSRRNPQPRRNLNRSQPLPKFRQIMHYAIVFFLSYWCTSATVTSRDTIFCSNPQNDAPCSNLNGPCCQTSNTAFQCVLDGGTTGTWQPLPCASCQGLEGDVGITCYQDSTVQTYGPPCGSNNGENCKGGGRW
jgi:hypothetical protein